MSDSLRDQKVEWPIENKAMHAHLCPPQGHSVCPECAPASTVEQRPDLTELCADIQRHYDNLMGMQSIGGAATLDELIDAVELLGRLAGAMRYREVLEHSQTPQVPKDIAFDKNDNLQRQIDRLAKFILSLDCGLPVCNEEYPAGMSATEAAEEYIKQLRAEIRTIQEHA